MAPGTWTATTGHTADVHWQAFDLTYRDASQLADRDAPQLAAPKVGVLVGNMHIPVSGSKGPSQQARRRIVGSALQLLTGLHVDGWRDRENFPVMRLLVGDCNLNKHNAEAVSQQEHTPPLTALQRDFELDRWQVCDVQFPRQALESSRRQNTNKKIPKITLAKIPRNTKKYKIRFLVSLYQKKKESNRSFVSVCNFGHHNGRSSPRTQSSPAT